MSIIISRNWIIYSMNRLLRAEFCRYLGLGSMRSHYRLHIVSMTAITGVLGLLIFQAIFSSAPSPLYAQFVPPLSPAFRGFLPSTVLSNQGVIPMCADPSMSSIPVSSIGMVNCPFSTVPVVMVTNPSSFSSSSSSLTSLCTYTFNSEVGLFGFGFTPTITLTDCVFFSSPVIPLIDNTIVTTAGMNFP
jgi:hypothetical protein